MISGFILINDLYYISFFGDKTFNIIFDRIPSRIYKNVRSNYAEL